MNVLDILLSNNPIVLTFIFSMVIGLLGVGLFLFRNSALRRNPIMRIFDILFWIVVFYLLLAAVFGWPPFTNWAF